MAKCPQALWSPWATTPGADGDEMSDRELAYHVREAIGRGPIAPASFDQYRPEKCDFCERPLETGGLIFLSRSSSVCQACWRDGHLERLEAVVLYVAAEHMEGDLSDEIVETIARSVDMLRLLFGPVVGSA